MHTYNNMQWVWLECSLCNLAPMVGRQNLIVICVSYLEVVACLHFVSNSSVKVDSWQHCKQLNFIVVTEIRVSWLKLGLEF